MAATSVLPPVHLHPVALRSAACNTGNNSATVQKSAQLASQQLRAAPAAVPTVEPSSPVLTQHAAAEAESSSKVYGLQHNSSRRYPPHPYNKRIKLISAQQYHDLQAQDLAQNTPESVLFPWMHGADQRGTQQAYYFGYANGGCKTPRFRGLTTVSCDSERPAYQPHSRISSLGSTSFASTSSVSSFTSSSSSSCSSSDSSYDSADSPITPASATQSGPERRASLLTSSFFPEDLLLPSEPPRFQRPCVPFNVNLRNFRLQASKFATVSDIVIYSADGLSSPELLPTAERFLKAQRDMRRTRLEEDDDEEDLLEYNVFVITDRFDVFERHFPSLVAVDSAGFPRNKVDFFEREREEMRILTQATEIADGVWLGNTQDVPIPALPAIRTQHATELSSFGEALRNAVNGTAAQTSGLPAALGPRSRMVSSDSSSSLDREEMEDGNPNAFSICIEAHDQAVMSTPDTFAEYDQLLANAQQINKDGSVDADKILHLECISTGQACVSAGSMVSFIDNLVHLVMWIRKQAKPVQATPPTASFTSALSRGRKAKSSTPVEPKTPRNILIHTTDGYTDTAVLALAYIMYDRACSLPQAYLHLQNDRSRSFFVYPADVELLGRVETRLMAVIAEERRAASAVDVDSAQTLPPPSLKSRFIRSASPAASLPRTVPAVPTTTAEKMIAAPWFYTDRFDGHFPSRILPFLYLGNLNHASNALMLKELGITHVVSIGESALVPPRRDASGGCDYAAAQLPTNLKARMPTNSLWLEHTMGNIKVLDLKGISDDGIDPITSYLHASEEFIEEARRAGGKVLVHCRVGVSRSATLVVAYVMKHLEIDLQSAYLLVRSRRLNILIQPTVLFMWTLQAYEAQLNRERAAQGLSTLGTRLAWPFLSREMCELNARYLNC